MGKPNSPLVIDDFPYFLVQDVWEYLSQHLDLTGCEQVQESYVMKKLEGRPQLTAMTVQMLTSHKTKHKFYKTVS